MDAPGLAPQRTRSRRLPHCGAQAQRSAAQTRSEITASMAALHDVRHLVV